MKIYAYLLAFILLTSFASATVVVGSTPQSSSTTSIVQLITNSSDYWDNLNTPSDITGSIYWYNHTTVFADWLNNFLYNYNQTTPFANWLSTFLYNYNQTYTGGFINTSYESTKNTTYELWAYNQTNTAFYNATYQLWSYNQTTTGDGSYNATYNTWAYNQTTPAITYANSQGWNSTYNSTYALYAYNQTQTSFINTSYESTKNTTYEKWAYNQSTDFATWLSTFLYNYNQTQVSFINTTYESTKNLTYELWSYNQTTPAISYASGINTSLSSRIDGLTGGNASWNESYASSLYLSKTDQRYNETNWVLSKGYINTSYNETYILWSYNQTTPAIQDALSRGWNSTYNTTYQSTSLEWDSNYSTYSKYWYNMTGGGADGSYNASYEAIRLDVLDNRSNWFSKLNVTYESTKNATYELWAYNQTTTGGFINTSYLNKNGDSAPGNLIFTGNITMGDRGNGQIDGAGYLSIFNNGTGNTTFALALKQGNTDYNAQYIWYNGSDFALGIDNWGYDGSNTGGVMVDSWGNSVFGFLSRTRTGNAIPLYLTNNGTNADILVSPFLSTPATFNLTNGSIILNGGGLDANIKVLDIGNSAKRIRLAASSASTTLSTAGLPLEIKSGTGLIYLDSSGVNNTLRIRDSVAVDTVLQGFSGNLNVSSGNVTAQLYKGDGSLLTNLPIKNTSYEVWSYNQTIPAMLYADSSYNYTSFNYNLTAFDCPGGKVVQGIQNNGSVLCVADAGGMSGDAQFYSINLTGTGPSNWVIQYINSTSDYIGKQVVYDDNGATYYYGPTLNNGLWTFDGMVTVDSLSPPSDNPGGVAATLFYGWNITEGLWVVDNVTAGNALKAPNICIGTDCKSAWPTAGASYNQVLNTTSNVTFANLTITKNSAFLENVTAKWFKGNITNTDVFGVVSSACTGTDKLTNITIINGVLTTVCSADQVGAGGAAINVTRLFAETDRIENTSNSAAYNQTLFTITLNANTNYTIDCGITLFTSSAATASHLNLSYSGTLDYWTVEEMQMFSTSTAPYFERTICTGTLAECIHAPAASFVSPGSMITIKGRMYTLNSGSLKAAIKLETGTTQVASAGKGSYCSLFEEP